MASIVTSQKWACIEGDDHEIAVVDDNNLAFLMSLMDEIVHDQVEDTDEERLRSVIQSLEAEINSGESYVDHDSMNMEWPDHRSISNGEDRQSFSLGQTDDHDFLVSFDDLDMNGLIDMDVAVPCSPSHDLNWYMYPGRDEISNDNFVNTYGGGSLDQAYEYNFLWQETTYDSVVYE
ncbi:hypothetical protein TIFTF001_026915 [Ficus carica]|uniref:Uncharacterized protein n=1 Tax=Ficus carica TaxID=3494 RepID=A0AA88IXN1_FICCA|nr:hypothetical protein TIFTF001_026915 [Ficus carica]